MCVCVLHLTLNGKQINILVQCTVFLSEVLRECELRRDDMGERWKKTNVKVNNSRLALALCLCAGEIWAKQKTF